MSTLTITQLEKIEFDLVAALAKLPAGARQMRTKALEVLAKVRVRKRELLAQSPDVLRKASAATPAAPHWFGLPSAEPEVTEMVRQYRDRQSEERRLSKASGRTRYQAPKHLHGRSCIWPTAASSTSPHTASANWQIAARIRLVRTPNQRDTPSSSPPGSG